MPEPTNTIDPAQQGANLPTDNGTPQMADPQKLVDEALNTPTPTTEQAATIPSPVTPAPEPAVTTPEVPAETVPQELLGGEAKTETIPEPITPEPAPIAAEAPSSNETPAGEELPLAFAGATPTTPTETEPVKTEELPPLPTPETTIPTTQPTEPEPAVFTPPPSMTPPKPEKKKRKAGKILATLVGFFLLIGGIVGGYYYYVGNFGEQAEIAAISGKSKDQCHGCSKPVDGGWLTWKNGKCTVTGICNSSRGDQKDTENPQAPADEIGAPSSCTAPGANGNTCCGTGYTYCGGGINKCVSHEAIAAHGGGCNSYGEQVHNIPTVYGANPALPDATGKCPSGYPKLCTCGTTKVCFDKTGFCDQKDVNSKGDSSVGQDYNKYGLCATAGNYSSLDANADFTLNNDTLGNSDFTCNNDGCTAKNSCTVYRYTCDGTKTGTSCLDNQETNTGGFRGKCGTVEQVDVRCNGKYVTSRTKINPPCDEKTTNPSNPPGAPTLACNTLTKDKATPKVGDQVQFTCAGASTPAGAVNLTYQFQIKKDNGNWTNLTAAANKANYTIAAVGSYSVRCKACGTINNASKCDPVWTEATQ